MNNNNNNNIDDTTGYPVATAIPVATNIPIATPIPTPFNTPNNTSSASVARDVTGRPLFPSKKLLEIKFNITSPNDDLKKNERFPELLYIPNKKIKDDMFSQKISDNDKKRLFISDIHINSQFIKAQRDTVIPQNNDLDDIIKFNIKYILNLFFENGNNIMLSGSKYTSIGYNWNNKFSMKNIYNGEIYSITIDIQLMKNYKTTFLDFTSDGCSKKYNNILKHYYSLIRKKGEVKANELKENELKENELKENEIKANEVGKNVAYTSAKGGMRSSSSSKHNQKKRKGQKLNHRMTKKITRKSTRKSTRRSHNK